MPLEFYDDLTSLSDDELDAYRRRLQREFQRTERSDVELELRRARSAQSQRQTEAAQQEDKLAEFVSGLQRGVRRVAALINEDRTTPLRQAGAEVRKRWQRVERVAEQVRTALDNLSPSARQQVRPEAEKLLSSVSEGRYSPAFREMAENVLGRTPPAAALHEVPQYLGLTNKQVYEAMGISKASFYRYRKGDRAMPEWVTDKLRSLVEDRLKDDGLPRATAAHHAAQLVERWGIMGGIPDEGPDRYEAIRQRMGLTQEQVASALGVTREVIAALDPTDDLFPLYQNMMNGIASGTYYVMQVGDSTIVWTPPEADWTAIGRMLQAEAYIDLTDAFGRRHRITYQQLRDSGLYGEIFHLVESQEATSLAA